MTQKRDRMNLIKTLHASRASLALARVGNYSTIHNDYGFVPGHEIHNRLTSIRYLVKDGFGFSFEITIGNGIKTVNFESDSSIVGFLAHVVRQIRQTPVLFSYVNDYLEDLFNWLTVTFIMDTKKLPAVVPLKTFVLILEKEYLRYKANI